MRIKILKHITPLFFLLLFALFSNYGAKAETAITSSEKVVVNQASSQLPHTTMELVTQELSPVGHYTIQKKIFPLAALQAGTGEKAPVAEESLFIKKSLLLIRGHLLFIYPFHHFW